MVVIQHIGWHVVLPDYFGIENADIESLISDELNDKRDSNIVYLKKSEILHGTYRITESSEDIQINFNLNDNY